MALPLYLKLLPAALKVAIAAHALAGLVRFGWRYEFQGRPAEPFEHLGRTLLVSRSSLPTPAGNRDGFRMLSYRLRADMRFDVRRKEFLHLGRRARTGIAEFDARFFLPAAAADVAQRLADDEGLRARVSYLAAMLERNGARFVRIDVVDGVLALCVVLGRSTEPARLFRELVAWCIDFDDAVAAKPPRPVVPRDRPPAPRPRDRRPAARGSVQPDAPRIPHDERPGGRSDAAAAARAPRGGGAPAP
jgi:hypothetical protein